MAEATNKQLKAQIDDLQNEIKDLKETIIGHEKAQKAGAPVALLAKHKTDMAEKDQEIVDLAAALSKTDVGYAELKRDLEIANEAVRGFKSGAAIGLQATEGEGGEGVQVQVLGEELSDEVIAKYRLGMNLIDEETGLQPFQLGSKKEFIRMITLAKRVDGGFGLPGAMIVRIVSIVGREDSMKMQFNLDEKAKIVEKGGKFYIQRGK